MEKTNRTKIFFIGIGLIIILLLIADFYAKRGLFGCFSPKLQIQKMALKYESHRETKRYLDRNQRLLADLEKKVAQAGSGDFEQARKNIPAVSRQFSSITWNGKLCYKMAKDQLCRSSDTQAALNEVLQPQIIRQCENGNLAIRNELENFLLRLAENENQFHARLALCTGNSKFYEGKDAARHQFLLDCSKLSGKLKADAMNRAMVIASAGLEIIFLRTTIKMAGTAFRHIIARLAATASTAAVCAAADGPLPVGDIIGAALGIGSLAWCAYDLYQISQVMPKEVHAALTKMVCDYQSNSRKQALEFAQKTLAEYQAAAGRITKNM